MDRLGNVIKSYLNNDDEKIFGSARGERRPSHDPDLDAAFDELNDFLNNDKARDEPGPEPHAPPHGPETSNGTIPEELRQDFAELGVAFGASGTECKDAYKKLLKIHHPDRHAGHEGNMKKATERTARINAAYDRIEKWRKG
ncbi:DnaJ domain protein [Leadbettera azotonutricia ZAS-9]|uniref:DnaJ domain protein n=2 Tax=Leadbettera azotonutricia TaxID=150829 RepID=F5YFI1_LEAAZ|nr:DnaJ domain protein [Leadbettera azotonutricia ZAS-9]